MADREINESGMHFNAINRNGKKYISLEDTIAYLKYQQQRFAKDDEAYHILHGLITSFIWCKNQK